MRAAWDARVGAGPARGRCLEALDGFRRGWEGAAPAPEDPVRAFVIEGAAARAFARGDHPTLAALATRWPGPLVGIGAGLGAGLRGLPPRDREDDQDGYGFWWGLVRGEAAWRSGRLSPHPSPAADRGQGRALWFWTGGSDAAARLIGACDQARQADLWHGLGVASTFTGGAPLAATSLRVAAGPHTASFEAGVTRALSLQTALELVSPDRAC